MPEELAKVVGANCKRLRPPASMEELADAARGFGMRWNSGSIAKIEAGSHKLTVQSLIVLAASLATVHDDAQIRVPDLLSTDEPIEITNEVAAFNGDVLVALLAGETTLEEPVETFIDRKLHDSLRLLSYKLAGGDPTRYALPPGYSLQDAVNLQMASKESERRIARAAKLGTPWFEAWSHHLWERSFTAERDARAGSDANAQQRGRVTRQMKEELRAALEASNGDD